MDVNPYQSPAETESSHSLSQRRRALVKMRLAVFRAAMLGGAVCGGLFALVATAVGRMTLAHLPILLPFHAMLGLGIGIGTGSLAALIFPKKTALLYSLLLFGGGAAVLVTLYPHSMGGIFMIWMCLTQIPITAIVYFWVSRPNFD